MSQRDTTHEAEMAIPKYIKEWEQKELPKATASISMTNPTIVRDKIEEAFLNFAFDCTKRFQTIRLEGAHEMLYYYQLKENHLIGRQALLCCRKRLLQARHTRAVIRNRKVIRPAEDRWFLSKGNHFTKNQCQRHIDLIDANQ